MVGRAELLVEFDTSGGLRGFLLLEATQGKQ